MHSTDVRDRSDARDDPVQPGPLDPADPDADGVVGPVAAVADRHQRHGVGRGLPLLAEHGEQGIPQQGEPEHQPRGEHAPPREDGAVHAPGLLVVVDRVRERRPRELERRHHERDRRPDAHAEREHADGCLRREREQEQAVRQVEPPQREARGNERKAEAEHRAQHRPVEVAVQDVTAVERDDRERDRGARVASGDQPERLVRQADHERGRERDRDRHVDDGDREVARRALLDAVQADRRLVHEADPEPDAREQPQRLGSRTEQERRCDRRQERRDRRDDEAGHRARGKRGADHRGSRLPLPLEREAEQGVHHPELRDRDRHGDERRERLDLAVVGRRQVVRVQRQQEQRGEPRHHGSEAVDQRLPAEAEQSAGSAGRRRRRHRYCGSSHSTWS